MSNQNRNGIPSLDWNLCADGDNGGGAISGRQPGIREEGLIYRLGWVSFAFIEGISKEGSIPNDRKNDQ